MDYTKDCFNCKKEVEDGTGHICGNGDLYCHPCAIRLFPEETATPLKIFEAFAGYGGGSFALKKIGIPFECVGYSEIDKNAIKCYDQNHPNTKNFGDISKVDTADIPDFDLFMGGFPCQDVSIAGRRDLSKGRTNLYKECIRICRDKQPKYLLLENVGGLLSMGTNRKLIDIIVSDFKGIGYYVFWKKLNSKDFGIPQSRDRVWICCFRDDIYEPFKFQFPIEGELKITIKDILEDPIPSKYNLNDIELQKIDQEILPKNTEVIIMDFRFDEGIRPRIDNISPTLCSSNRKGISTLPMIYSDKFRYLTPKECFRLMGFLKDEINLEGLSDSACYKLAGNGWEINLASKVLKNMLSTFQEQNNHFLNTSNLDQEKRENL